MKILYISTAPSKKQFLYMQNKRKNPLSYFRYGIPLASFKFHHSVISGISQDETNEVYALIGRATSWEGYQGVIWKKEIEQEESITYEHIGFLNLPILKNVIVSCQYFLKTLKWLKKYKAEKRCIIIDASYVTVLPFINLATKIVKCPKIGIVCDIYQYMAPVQDARKKKYRRYQLISKFMKGQYAQLDGFVFLTDAMNEILNLHHRPYIVMEGLIDLKMKENRKIVKNSKDVVMYAGSLKEVYGLKNLVEGFQKYSNKNAEMWIYGVGDYVDDILEQSKLDSRIKYFGMVDYEEVVKKEMEATILVNPRPTDKEFTKYSFPSKNMEYMASGTPLLSTKLPGIPSEYYDYIYTIDGNTSEDITIALEKVFSLPRKEIYNKGKKAKEFVLQNKNNTKQAQRIMKLCQTVCDTK